MGMCYSGSLGILSAPQGGCSNISLAVDGNSTPPKSLECLGVTAGFPLPIKMSCFYGWCNIRQISFSPIGASADGGTTTCACLCINSVTPMINGQCYTIDLRGSLGTVGQGTSSSAYLCVTCQNVCKWSCAIGANACTNSICCSFAINYGEVYNVIIYAQTTCTACGNCACATAFINGITPITGCIGLGSTSTSCSKYTG